MLPEGKLYQAGKSLLIAPKVPPLRSLRLHSVFIFCKGSQAFSARFGASYRIIFPNSSAELGAFKLPGSQVVAVGTAYPAFVYREVVPRLEEVK